VREHIAQALLSYPPGRIRLISRCAGDGRDLIGMVANHPRREDVSASLIEINSERVTQGEVVVASFPLASQVHFLRAAATLSDTYLSVAPADLVLAASVFGNVRAVEEGRLVWSLRSLRRLGGSVIWTRYVGDLDGEQASERIRQLLKEAGFRELVRTRTVPSGFAIDMHGFSGDPQPLVPATKLFEFTGYDRIGAV
jgi:hypothetical protein